MRPLEGVLYLAMEYQEEFELLTKMKPSLRIFTVLLTVIIQGSTGFGQLLSWNSPINRTHAGILLGNGTQGLMVWGIDTLNITAGHAGLTGWENGQNGVFA